MSQQQLLCSRVIMNGRRAAIPSGNHMIDRARHVKTRFTGHVGNASCWCHKSIRIPAPVTVALNHPFLSMWGIRFALSHLRSPKETFNASGEQLRSTRATR